MSVSDCYNSLPKDCQDKLCKMDLPTFSGAAFHDQADCKMYMQYITGECAVTPECNRTFIEVCMGYNQDQAKQYQEKFCK